MWGATTIAVGGKAFRLCGGGGKMENMSENI